MTIAVAAPEYFPGMELAALALSVDVLVVADTFRYSRQSRQNRARLRTPTGAHWMTIPVRGGQFGRSIASIEIDDKAPWRRAHLKSLRFHYGGAAFHEHYREAVSAAVMTPSERLADVTLASLRWALGSLGCEARMIAASSMPRVPGSVQAIRTQFPGATLVLGPAQPAAGGPCARLAVAPFEYRQAFDGFSGGMSVLDLLLNHGPRAAELLREHARITEEVAA